MNNMQAPASPRNTVFRARITINNKPLNALINSGASGNFMSLRYVQANEIATRKKDVQIRITVVNGSSLPNVSRETVTL